MAILRTLAAPLTREPPKIKGSRFIGSLSPIETEKDAADFVEVRRSKFRGATHTCFAWRLDDGGGCRSSDDGEPSGTAGRPMLKILEGHGLVKVVAVVTRYYGGTKLGTGGLVRAYGGAVAAALEDAEIVETVLTRTLRLRFTYELSSAVQGALHGFGVEPGRAEYAADVRMDVAVPEEQVERLAEALKEATAGRIEVAGS